MSGLSPRRAGRLEWFRHSVSRLACEVATECSRRTPGAPRASLPALLALGGLRRSEVSRLSTSGARGVSRRVHRTGSAPPFEDSMPLVADPRSPACAFAACAVFLTADAADAIVGHEHQLPSSSRRASRRRPRSTDGWTRTSGRRARSDGFDAQRRPAWRDSLGTVRHRRPTTTYARGVLRFAASCGTSCRRPSVEPHTTSGRETTGSGMSIDSTTTASARTSWTRTARRAVDGGPVKGDGDTSAHVRSSGCVTAEGWPKSSSRFPSGRCACSADRASRSAQRDPRPAPHRRAHVLAPVTRNIALPCQLGDLARLQASARRNIEINPYDRRPSVARASRCGALDDVEHVRFGPRTASRACSRGRR